MKYAYPVSVNGAGTKAKSFHGEYDKTFSWLKKQGYDGIELLIKNPHEVDLLELDLAVEKWNLPIAAVGTGPMQMEEKLFLLHPDENVRKEAMDRIDGFLKLCRRYKAPALLGKYRGQISEHPGCGWSDLEKTVRYIYEKAESYDVTVLIEPQNSSNINNLNTVLETARWIESLHCPGLGILADVFHMGVTKEPLEESFLKAADKIGLIHMSDSERKIPGMGELDLGQVIRALENIHYQGYISFEIDQIPDSKKASRASILHMKQLERRET